MTEDDENITDISNSIRTLSDFSECKCVLKNKFWFEYNFRNFDSQPSSSEINYHCLFVGVPECTARLWYRTNLLHYYNSKIKSNRIANRCIDYNQRNVDRGKFSVHQFSSLCWSPRALRVLCIRCNCGACHLRTLSIFSNGWPRIRLGSSRLSFICTFRNVSGNEFGSMACHNRDYADKGLLSISVHLLWIFIDFVRCTSLTDKKLWIFRLCFASADYGVHFKRTLSADSRVHWTIRMDNILRIGVHVQCAFWDIFHARNKRKIPWRNYVAVRLIKIG